MWRFFRPISIVDSKKAALDSFQERAQLLNINSVDMSTKGLANHLGITDVSLLQIIRRETDPYTEVKIKKRNGGVRILAVPSGPTKTLQNMLLKDYLNSPGLAHDRAFAFITGKSSVEAVREHKNAQWLVKVDLKDFYHFIDEKMVYESLRQSSVDAYKSFFVSRVVTRATAMQKAWLPKKYSKTVEARFRSTNPVGIKRLGYLPQGASTSGAVSNLVAFNLDNHLHKLATSEGLVFTRYADDMAFSSREPLDRSRSKRLLSRIFDIIRYEGFTENPKKTRIYGSGTPLKYLGLEIFEGSVRLSKRYKKYVEDNLRGIEKFGLYEHTQHRNFNSPLQLINHLHGKAVWAMSIERNWAKTQINRLEVIGISYPELFGMVGE